MRAHVCRRGQAIADLKRGLLDRASETATTCLQEALQLKNDNQSAYSHILQAIVAIHRGDYAKARRTLEHAISPSVASGHKSSLLAIEFLGDVELGSGDITRAMELYGECLTAVSSLSRYRDINAELRRRRSDCHLALNEAEYAHSEALVGLELSRKLGDRYEEAATYRVLAMSAAALGRNDEARQWFEQGFAYYDDIETPYEWGRLWMAYGDWLSGPQAADADSPAALRAYMSARDLFERMGALGKLAEVNARIDRLTQPGGSPALELVTPAQTRRRRRPTADVERRSTWALDNFGIVTRYVGVLDLLEEVEKFAPTDSPILILGESGTGKELVARGVHRLSGRRGQFIAINCAAMPREIIESELFGHVAGSFTGASKDRSGLLEDCEHGTVFLDEIGEMALDLQARLLRFLESGEVRRVGSSRNRTLDTRVVAATNRDRMSLEHGDRFRADLYYRLAHAVVTLPPVRRRGEDVELLIHHFMEEACRREKKQVRLTERAVDRMVAYAWPGNVRQMRSVIRRAVILARPDGEIDLEALQLDDPRFPATLSEELEHAERQRLIEALRHANGSRTLAAKALGIPRTTLLNKMKRFGIT
ncbi:MAG TPA: sigma 54-interacting transcriptional regulator [Candidatus Eisenbacteria bacterium]|nr:sigma 54-interacting transcriptional regulator [Candidatus Eisenbacteria bacterium]